LGCLNQGHITEECTPPYICRHCSGSHNTALHDNEEKNEEGFRGAEAKLITGTDLVILKGKISQGKITEKAKILLDTGSPQKQIFKEFVKNNKLETTKTEKGKV
jgi:hypothetical protein